MITKEQRDHLKSLVKHPGWKVVELINEQDLVELGKQFLNTDLRKEENIKIIEENQSYAKARNDLLRSIKDQTIDFYVPSIK